MNRADILKLWRDYEGRGADAVVLFAQAVEAAHPQVAWTQTPPQQPGWYWVWQAQDTWPCHGDVHAVLVESYKGTQHAWAPRLDFNDPVVVSDSNTTWTESWWYGPVAAPEPPMTHQEAIK